MVIALIGESCTGKSTIAESLKQKKGASVYSGKDYLRLSKNESDAKSVFVNMLYDKLYSEEYLVYVISEKENLDFLPIGSVQVLCEAGLDTKKERFAQRMNGNLPKPVEEMVERKHGMFEDVSYDLRFNTDDADPDHIVNAIGSFLQKEPYL